MGYTGRHRKTSSLTRTKRHVAMVTAFAGVAASGVVAGGTASAAPLPIPGAGSSSLADDIIGEITGAFPIGDITAKPAEGSLTSGYGPRWGAMHNGIDIANGIGTPIHAVMGGVVTDSGPASGYGNWIRVKHNDGSVSVYGHMETLAVSVGQTVTAGQYIAGMGNQGHSTGSHLHFEIHPNGSTPVDPQEWLAARGIHF
ncbi:M23 family metallopeptidase [uncultured Corynebacterium sp.]|uniref:M23 family metallopeptidase n=1 Tax=uncultured Corynebacterium sp. TaxID=159447 RepID=UPI0025CDDD03|nr:M23 family metallopeptidase [uncultured Corynebacterium sp.]